MKWKLRIVAIAVAGLFVTASVGLGQQSRGIRNAGNATDDGNTNGSLISASDESVSRISVGDEEPPPVPGKPIPPSPPGGNWASGQGVSPTCGCNNPACCTPGCTNRSCDPCNCVSAGTAVVAAVAVCFNGWVTAEYLHVWAKGMGLPPLATTDTPPGQGQLGPGSTATVLFGGNVVGTNLTPSGRISAGLWLDESETDGVMVRFLGVGGNKHGFSGDTAGFPVLATPFFNTNPINPPPGINDANVYSYPGRLAGSLNVNTVSNIYSTDALFRWNVSRDVDYRIDLLGGYQNSLLTSGVTVDGFSTALSGPATGTTFDIRDAFVARNSFNGGVIGLLGEAGRGPWTVSGLAKVGIGQFHQTVKINGSSTVNDGINPPQTFAGGVFAQPTNIGNYNRNKFGVIPELGLNLNRTLTRNLDFNFGYTFVYWSNVAMAGNQINTTVNGSQLLGGTLAGAAQPTHTFNTNNYYINAINFGLTFHY